MPHNKRGEKPVQPFPLVYRSFMSDDRFDFGTLLTLQGLDTSLQQIHHRLRHLPLDTEIAALDERAAGLVASISGPKSEAAGLDAQQSELETKLHEVDTKIDAAAKSLYGGTVTATRELQALEADIASLKKHRNDLEDAELEILLAREPLDESIAKVNESIAAKVVERATLVEQASAEREALTSEAIDLAAKRASLAASVPESVLSVYDKVRPSNNGIGAARLEHGTCMGCRMKLSAVEIDRIKSLPTDALACCEECGAVLVR